MDSKREKEIFDAVLQFLIREFSPQKIYLFGSRAKGKNRVGSDFDFALDVQKPPYPQECKVKEHLEKIIGLYSTDLVYLPNVEPEFKQLILKTGKLVYDKGRNHLLSQEI